MRAPRSLKTAVLALASAVSAAPAFAAFPGTDLFLPLVGRNPGISPSQWYCTVWVYNPGDAAADVSFYLLERDKDNTTAVPFTDTVQPGDTKRYDNAVFTMFGRNAWGALRVVSSQKVVVNERFYNQATGTAEKDSQGQYFAGLPKSFAIGLGEKTDILGVYQTAPAADSQLRYNFGFVEVAGASCKVRVTPLDETGAALAAPKDYTILASSQRQFPFKDIFPGVSATNARVSAEVVSGSGKVIAYGTGITNGAQDPTTFEMGFKDRLLAENVASPITAVSAGTGLSGGGTSGNVTLEVGAGAGISVQADTVSIATGGVTAAMLAPGAQAGQVLTTVSGGAGPAGQASTLAAGVSVAWQSPTPQPSSGPAGGALSGTYPNPGIASGQVVKSLNGLKDEVTLAATGAVTITPSGNTLTIGSNGIALPFSGTVSTASSAFAITNTGAGPAVSGNAPNANGVVGTSSAPGYAAVAGSNDNGYGVYGVANNPSYAGVYGSNTSGYGGRFTTSGNGDAIDASSTGGGGVHGFGATYGVFGETSSSSFGYGVRGASTKSYGGFFTSDTSFGVYGRSIYGNGVRGGSSTGEGVYGGSGTGDGVYGYSDFRFGVEGVSYGNYSGVAGINNGAAAGVYGQSSSGLAGYFDGNVSVVGNLTKTTGSFKIDHPLDPEHKYLYHSFVESPDMKNIYDGVAVTDGNGEAIVELPAWFEALNRDFRYQLTVIGRFAQAIIEQEVDNNRFTIRTNLANVKVSWQLTGIRKDPYAEKHRIPVEENKPAIEQGSYLHPDAYGQPEEKSVEWARNPEMMRGIREERKKAATERR